MLAQTEKELKTPFVSLALVDDILAGADATETLLTPNRNGQMSRMSEVWLLFKACPTQYLA